MLKSIFNFIDIHRKQVQPVGLFVCLIGPDGSGKTSIAKAITQEFEMDSNSEGFSAVHYYHGHFGILPELKVFDAKFRQLLGRSPKKNKIQVTPAQNLEPPSFSPIRAIIYLLYYSLDYILGGFIIRKAKAKTQLTLFDRYYYDYLIQSTFRRVPRFVFWGMLTFIPTPDLIIFLNGDANVIHSRKPELRPEQIKTQQAICQQIIQKVGRGKICQSDVQFETTLNEVKAAIYEAFMENMQITHN